MDLLIHIVPQLAREFACPLPTTGNVPDRSSVVVAAAGEEDNYDNDQAVVNGGGASEERMRLQCSILGPQGD